MTTKKHVAPHKEHKPSAKETAKLEEKHALVSAPETVGELEKEDKASDKEKPADLDPVQPTKDPENKPADPANGHEHAYGALPTDPGNPQVVVEVDSEHKKLTPSVEQMANPGIKYGDDDHKIGEPIDTPFVKVPAEKE